MVPLTPAGVGGRGNRTDHLHGFDNLFRKRRLGIRVLFVKIKSVRLPVLVQAEIQIKIRLPFQPGDVRADFGGLRISIITVQINAIGVPAPVQHEADGIQARQQINLRVLRPAVFVN